MREKEQRMTAERENDAQDGNVLRVAHVVGKMHTGGVKSVVMNYYRHIDRSAIQFDFIVDADSTQIPYEEIERLGGRVFVVPRYEQLPSYLAALRRLFREQRYRIVHAHINTLNVFPLFVAWCCGVPVRIAHNHSTAAPGEGKKNFLKYTLRPFAKVFATRYAACTELAGRWLFGKRTMVRGDVTIFNNAIECDRFRFDAQARSETRAALGLADRFVVGHIGRFCYQKNHPFLIDLFAQVLEHEPNAVLLLVGEGPDRPAVEQLVEVRGLSERIRFLGNRDDVARLYSAMDVLVLPSRYEGLPVVGVEAQAAGLPCIFSDRITPAVKLTEPVVFRSLTDDPALWVDAILRDWGERSSGSLPPEFDIDRQAEKMGKIYNELSSL